MALCKGCGAEIIFVITDAGKTMPLDAQPEKRFILIGARVPTARLEDVYTSHFASCPKAEAFRKSKAHSH